MEPITLYHVGFEQIPVPDVHYGRKNADFGQGFYLSDSEDFSKRWARERRGMDTVINCYELTLDGLNVKRLVRGEYSQTVIKTESAASQLRFISAEVLDSAEIAACRELVSAEETAFQELFSAELERLIGSE